MTRRLTPHWFAAVLALALFAAPAAASPSYSATPAPTASAAPLFGGYWSSFIEHWSDVVKKQNGVVMVALGIGAISLVIITRGKWLK